MGNSGYYITGTINGQVFTVYSNSQSDETSYNWLVPTALDPQLSIANNNVTFKIYAMNSDGIIFSSIAESTLLFDAN